MIEFRNDIERRLWCRVYEKVLLEDSVSPSDTADYAVKELRKREPDARRAAIQKATG